MNRDLIVVGGSSGAVEAVLNLSAGLPADLPAAVLIVLHVTPKGGGDFAGLIGRTGPLPCALAEDGEMMRPGRIYLARPDHHLLVGNGRLQVVIGPRENRHRPAIDPLFRSAAVGYGTRVIGVILSGNLDDGSAGLALIKRQGGRVVVQDPADALYPAMPGNALNAVRADHVVPLPAMAGLLARLAEEEIAPGVEASEGDRLEAAVPANRLLSEERMREVAAPSVFPCPDCGGNLLEYKDRQVLRYRCSIGHALSGLTLLAEQAHASEAALAASFQSLVAHERLYSRLIEDFERRNMRESAADMRLRAEETRRHAAVIQNLLSTLGGGA